MSDLPANVTAVPDRHGKIRYRFRRKGWKSAYLKGDPGSVEFHRSYADILAGGGAEAESAETVHPIAARSVDDLAKALGMDGIPKSQVSRLCADIDERVSAFLTRPLEGAWPYALPLARRDLPEGCARAAGSSAVP